MTKFEFNEILDLLVSVASEVGVTLYNFSDDEIAEVLGLVIIGGDL